MEKHFKCTKHHQVFFCEKAMRDHVRKKCRRENIIRIDTADELGDMLDAMIKEVIKAR
ncbi:MAG: hypothetical protein Q8P40_04400 [Nitrospirota bacterium]|nr:hypothetical protein [Nitrospirota bacterium]